MDPNRTEADHASTKQPESGSSFRPLSTAGFPPGVQIGFLPELTGKCTIVSNTDLSLVDHTKIPRHTLEFIRAADGQCKKTVDQINEKWDGSENKFKIHRLGEQFQLDTSNAYGMANNAAGSEGVVHHGLSRRGAVDEALKRKPPNMFLVRDGRNGHTFSDESVKTAYNAYLASCADEEREPGEGLPKEVETFQAPPLGTSSTTLEVPKLSNEEARTIQPSPSITPQLPPVSLSSSLQPTGQAHDSKPPAHPWSARSALSSRRGVTYTTVIAVPVWPPGVIEPICKTDNYCALQNPLVRTALSLCLEYCRSKEASEDPNFAERAMTQTLFMIDNELDSDIELKLAVRKRGTTEQIDGDRGSDPSLRFHAKGPDSDDGAANSYLEDLKDAPGYTYFVPDPVGELKRRVDSTMSAESSKSFVPGSTLELE